RLSSSGYVFSASLPPYIASAAITAINILEENPELLSKLKNNISHSDFEIHRILQNCQKYQRSQQVRRKMTNVYLKKLLSG
ncbi:hypothetical protein S83_032743, partial [Arachis hypogaea]